MAENAEDSTVVGGGFRLGIPREMADSGGRPEPTFDLHGPGFGKTINRKSPTSAVPILDRDDAALSVGSDSGCQPKPT